MSFYEIVTADILQKYERIHQAFKQINGLFECVLLVVVGGGGETMTHKSKESGYWVYFELQGSIIQT